MVEDMYMFIQQAGYPPTVSCLPQLN